MTQAQERSWHLEKAVRNASSQTKTTTSQKKPWAYRPSTLEWDTGNPAGISAVSKPFFTSHCPGTYPSASQHSVYVSSSRVYLFKNLY